MSVTVGYMGTGSSSQKAIRYFNVSTAAELPTSGYGLANGDLGYAQDTDSIYAWDGSAWDQFVPLSATGVANQVAFFSGINSLGGDPDFVFDPTSPALSFGDPSGLTAPGANEFHLFRQSNDAVSAKLKFYKSRASGAQISANDILGSLEFFGRNSTPADIQYGRIRAAGVDATAGGEDGAILLDAIIGGALTEYLRFGSDGTNAGIIFNESSADIDLRYETNDQTHALFGDAGNNRIGFFQSSPACRVHVTEPTIGNEIFRLESVATNDDPRKRWYQGRVTTTDATVTTVATIAIEASRTYQIAAWVVARRTGGTSGTAEDGASYLRVAAFNTIGGVVTIIGAVSAAVTQENQAAWDCTIASDGGTNALIRVTGAANNNVTWHATIEVTDVGS